MNAPSAGFGTSGGHHTAHQMKKEAAKLELDTDKRKEVVGTLEQIAHYLG